MTNKKSRKIKKDRKFNVTVTFCENEEENQIAFENAVKAILFKNDPRS